MCDVNEIKSNFIRNLRRQDEDLEKYLLTEKTEEQNLVVSITASDLHLLTIYT